MRRSPIVVALFVASALAAGCLKPDLQACGDLVCPQTEVCLDASRCVPAETVEACADHAAGDSCTDPVVGRCAAHGEVLACEPATCGDAVVDLPLREDCDGDALVDQQCADLGFDLGRPACTATCRFDLAACTRFGWTELASAPVYRMVATADTLVYARHQPEELVIVDGTTSQSLPMPFVDHLAAGGGRIVVDSDQLYDLVAGQPVSLNAPFPSASSVVVDATRTIYATHGCDLWRYDTLWAKAADLNIAFDGNCVVELQVASDLAGVPHVFMFNGAGAIWELVGSAVVKRYDGSVLTFAAGAPLGKFELFISSNELGVIRLDLATAKSEIVMPQPATSLVVAPHYVIGENNGLAQRWNGAFVDTLRVPAAKLFADANRLYAYGNGPIFRFSGIDFGELGPPTFGNEAEHMTGLYELANGGFVASSFYALYSLDPLAGKLMSTPSPVQPLSIGALHGVSEDIYVMGTYVDEQPDRNGVWLHDGNTLDISPAEKPSVDGVWMADASTIFAAGYAPGYVGKYTGAAGTWTSQILPECEMHGVFGTSATHVIAVGACNGTASVWQFDGTTWSELHREPRLPNLFAVRIFGDTIVAIGEFGGLAFDGATWTVEPEARGTSMSGPLDDLWIAGTFTPIRHFDGTAWSKMTTRTLGRTVVAVTPDRVIMLGGAQGHVALVRSRE